MNKLFTFLLISTSIWGNAQQSTFNQYLKNKKALLLFPESTNQLTNAALSKTKVDMATLAKQTLLTTIPELQIENSNLKLVHSYQSLVGTHFQFVQTYLETEIYLSNIKIALNEYGSVINIISNLSDLRGIKKLPKEPLVSNLFWICDGQQLVAAKKQIENNKEQIFDVNNTLVYEQIKSLSKGKKDTNVMVKLFNPDPLTTARSAYVAPYLNYNKMDTPSLNNQRKDVNLNLVFNDSSNSFMAENKYVLIKDLFAPSIPPFNIYNISNLTVTRATDVFKQEMAMFHIAQYQNYIQSLGFNNLQRQLWVDALGDFAESSRFEFSGSEPYLILAVGGIPDAEDADVITHEYTHAIGYFIAPNTADGEERIGIDEGNADIIAVIYSLKLSDYNWRKVFSWDGNETWNGRSTLNNKNYKTDFALARYQIGDIWSGAVTDIAEDIGIDNTVKILLTSMASYQNNMTLPQFAKIFIQSDSILFQKKHFGPISNSFATKRSIIEPLSVKDNTEPIPVSFINTQGFANNNESLQINVPIAEFFNIDITTIEGKTIQQFTHLKNSVILNPNDYKSGIYLVKVSAGNKTIVQKIIKY